MTTRVLALRADDGACAKYRIKEPVTALQAAGYDFEIDVRPDVGVEAVQDAQGHITVKEVTEDVDLMIIQRPLAHSWVGVIKQAQKQGIAVIVELDDDFSSIHPDNIAWKDVQPKNQPLSNYQWLNAAANAADYLTVSTPYLQQRYAPNGGAYVLRNFIPSKDVQHHEHIADAPAVGWSGTMQTHPHDLQAARDGIARGVVEVGADFMVVGDAAGVSAALHLPSSVPVNGTGWAPLNEYMSTLASSIDIGVVPLEDSNFNAAKSGLKGIEMAACGIPFIASPLPEYRRLNAYGLGLLAKSPGDWRRHISRLNRQRKWQVEGEKAREVVQKDFLLENHIHEWATAWSTAVRIRQERGVHS